MVEHEFVDVLVDVVSVAAGLRRVTEELVWRGGVCVRESRKRQACDATDRVRDFKYRIHTQRRERTHLSAGYRQPSRSMSRISTLSMAIALFS